MSDPWLQRLERTRAIAVIRTDDSALSEQLACAVAAGGIEHIEITWNSDRPAATIANLRQRLPNCHIGAGTLLTATDVETAIAAGAQFLFSPHVAAGLIDQAVAAEVPIVPGALTPTEIVTAWQAGATAVKVFPALSLGGATYIKSLRAPLGEIPLIPTGGINLENAPGLLAAGAVAIGLSSQLFPHALVLRKDWEGIAARSRQLLQVISMPVP